MRLYSDKAGKAGVRQHCFLGARHLWPLVPLGGRVPSQFAQQP